MPDRWREEGVPPENSVLLYLDATVWYPGGYIHCDGRRAAFPVFFDPGLPDLFPGGRGAGQKKDDCHPRGPG